MFRLMLIAVLLSGCATTGSKFDESKAINEKLITLMAKDAANRVKSSYQTKKTWRVDSSNRYGKALSIDLRKNGFGVDENNKAVEEIVFYVDRFNPISYRSTLVIGKTKLSRAYIGGALPVPVSDWSIGVFHE